MTLDSATPISSWSQKFRRAESIYSRFWLFLCVHTQKLHYTYFQSEICCLHHFQQHRFPMQSGETGNLTVFWLIFGHVFTWTDSQLVAETTGLASHYTPKIPKILQAPFSPKAIWGQCIFKWEYVCPRLMHNNNSTIFQNVHT